MDLKNLKNVPVLWKPSGDKGKYFTLFIKLLEEKYQAEIDTYWDLHKWSTENIEEFWGEIWDFTGIIYSKKYDQVIDLTTPMRDSPKWFEGARLNLAENLMRHRDNNIALIGIGEDRERRDITYAEVYEEVKLYAAALRKHGLKRGDRVVCYMSNREEAIFSMLGVVSIGAIFVGALPMLGSQAILDRVQQVDPTIIIGMDRFRFNGEEIDMLSKLKFIANEIPTLEKIIILASQPNSNKKDISDIPNSCFLDEFLALGRQEDGSVPDIIFEQVPFSHPVFISHTSGTTGTPKALVHDSGCLITVSRDQWLLADASRDGRYLSASPVGWASWVLSTMGFVVGTSIVVYDGSPYFLTPTHLWDIVDEYKVNGMFLTPGNLDDMEKKSYIPTKNHKLTSLRIIYAGASVVRPQNYDFVYQKIKKDIIFSSFYGSTEVMGSCMTLHRTLPVHRGEIACPCLGVDLQCVDESGKAVVGQLGELLIVKPIPSLLTSVWGDKDGTKFREKYFSKYPDYFAIGDLAVINPYTRGIIIYCRSDDVLNQFGCRFGSSEIYCVVNALPEIRDSLCVSQYSKSRNERAVLFLKLKEGYKLDDKLMKKVQDTVEKELTDEHIPGLIMEIPDIPYNINGKKMESLIKKLINNQPYNPDVVINKECLEYYFNTPPFEG